MTSPSLAKRLGLFLFVAILGCSLDLASKNWIFDWLGDPGHQPVWWVIPDLFGFQTSLNQGALFGMGQGKIFFFVATSFIAMIGVIFWIIYDRRHSTFLAFLLGLIAAGISGNLWDRLSLHGMVWNVSHFMTGQCPPEAVGHPVHAVRDWILVMFGSWPWPNFNLADSMLVAGAILLAWYAFKLDRLDRSSKQTPPGDK